MYISYMEGCCKAQVLTEFGGGEKGDSVRNEITNFDDDGYISLEKAIKQVDERFKTMKRMGTPKIIFATTTSNQPAAEKLLTHLGFYTSRKATKTSGGRKLRAWFLPLDEYKGEK